jgi:hypothetical protein
MMVRFQGRTQMPIWWLLQLLVSIALSSSNYSSFQMLLGYVPNRNLRFCPIFGRRTVYAL